MSATVEAPVALTSLNIEPIDPDRDAALVQGWLAHPASSWWELGHLDIAGVRDYLRTIQAHTAQAAWLGRHDGEPCFLVETYDPAAVLLTDVWAAEPGDVGMHLLVAPPPAKPVHGLTSAIMRSVVAHCRNELGARRIVVEPDVRNTAIQAKNAEVGFRALREVSVAGKRALLSVLDLDREPAAHLRPEHLDAAQRHLTAKIIAEFAHERLIVPVADGDGENDGDNGPSAWQLNAKPSVYRFRARLHTLEHWALQEQSLTRERDGHPMPLDAQDLILELRAALGIPDSLLGTYLEEIAATLASAAAKHRRGGSSAARLARGRPDGDVADGFQEAESAMTEGHPAFVAANGRIGFGLDEYHAYAPESGATFRYRWIAARREHAHLALTADRTTEQHEAELDPDTADRFREVLAGRGLDPADYLWIPVHPWQWQHRIAVAFAPDLGQERLVELGEAPDRHQPQQSIRTAFNRDRPDRSYIKTALSVQNMGFLRGLSATYMRSTPAVNDWVARIVASDETLRAAGFDILREHASIGYTGDAYHQTGTPSPQRKMLAALWRESPIGRLEPGERPISMAALLHRDPAGGAVVSELVRGSGLSAGEWVHRYLHAYLRPLLHCLTVHDLAFMPHGENTILLLRDQAVVRVLMKDIGEEVAVLAKRAENPVPTDIERIVHPVGDEEAAMSIFTDVFDGFLRFLAAILDEDGVLSTAAFWRIAGECVDRHADEHPHRRRPLDFRAKAFTHSCLNRLQLRNTVEMVDLANQAGSLIRVGSIENPIGRAGKPRQEECGM